MASLVVKILPSHFLTGCAIYSSLFLHALM